MLAGLVHLSAGTAYAAGTIRAGSDVSYAPLEFFDAKHAMQGFDVDLAKAISQHMGETIVLSNHTFDDLIPSVQKGSFDVAISAMSDTRAREAKVDFVDYMLAGSGMLVPFGNPKRIFDLAGICGLKVDVQRGTSQDTALQDQAKKCADVHLGQPKIMEFSTDDEAFKNFVAGKSDVHVTDYPVVAFLAATNDHKYTVAGRQFDLVPYGIAIAKTNAALRNRVAAALMQVIADGTYDSLLKKWGLEQGALRSVPINAGTLFSH